MNKSVYAFIMISHEHGYCLHLIIITCHSTSVLLYKIKEESAIIQVQVEMTAVYISVNITYIYIDTLLLTTQISQFLQSSPFTSDWSVSHHYMLCTYYFFSSYLRLHLSQCVSYGYSFLALCVYVLYYCKFKIIFLISNSIVRRFPRESPPVSLLISVLQHVFVLCVLYLLYDSLQVENMLNQWGGVNWGLTGVGLLAPHY